MKILVINCGSSSLKFQLLDMSDESLQASGLVERIALDGSRLVLKTKDGEKLEFAQPLPDHTAALKLVMDVLVKPELGILGSLEEIEAVGHRVVHAGEAYASSVIITDEVIAAVEKASDLAPLHNPPNLMGIYAMQEILPGVPNVGVFDTAFHQTMEPAAYIYPIPYEYYEKYRVRRYGFHGTSHKYVFEKAAEFLGMPKERLRTITCHLGNGASLTAIQGGKSIDTTMGFTPLEGLVMGTRSGNIDPAIYNFIMEKENLTGDEMDRILNKESGVKGVSGVSNDFRDIEEAADAGNERAKLALQIFARTVRKYIGSYTALMCGLDCLVFTGGLGENSARDRAIILENMECMGIKIDPKQNMVRGKLREISTFDSPVKVLVVPTNEELAIARDTLELVRA